MRIVVTRRMVQVFFLLLFLWFCVVTTYGTRFWEWRGWPVNLFLELDPLTALGTLLSTGTVYRGMLWALLTVVVTALLGRVFCGWICPFGTLHQFIGWLGQLGRKPADKRRANEFRGAQRVKYGLLIVFLVLAVLPFGGGSSLQTGLLDPIPFVYRSVNLVLLPAAGHVGAGNVVVPRQYHGTLFIGAAFLAALALNLYIPRFYCRIVCPLGALLGLIARRAPWRIIQRESGCTHCTLCEFACEGACNPSGKIRQSECVMCTNCLDGVCRPGVLTYGTGESAHGEIPGPDMGRRGVVLSLASGIFAIPAVRVAGQLGSNWDPALVRPPGSLSEAAFLERCIKCGQCMRVCPTNVIMPAGLDKGFEALWTPFLDFRNGSSGCQLNCVACGTVCPVAAIRPITLEEKHGAGKFASRGPIRIGTAFVDRSRCLPWAMGTPCLVCQENCPVTPKAIQVKDLVEPVRGGAFKVVSAEGGRVTLDRTAMHPGQYATGDYHLTAAGGGATARWRIVSNTENEVELSGEVSLNKDDLVQVEIDLHAPVVEPALCIGCGVCEHECPVSGLRAIRVSAENESRDPKHSFMVERKPQI